MGSESILVVDDEWDIGEVVVYLLGANGYETRYASNGSVALEMLAQAPADLVLTDLMMPVTDGSALVRKMRAMNEFAATPILVMSALPEEILRRECPLATAFLRKSFSSAQLLDAVRKILD